MITGEQGLFAQANYTANTYKAAQENETSQVGEIYR